MSEWKKYEGTDEQIEEIKNTEHGYVLRKSDGKEVVFMSIQYRPNLDKVTHYLICSPHPLADMIERWARTGQPVYFKYQLSDEFGNLIPGEFQYGCTCVPHWEHPNTEYSFTPFGEEK